jgi:hypothetical protein
MLLRDVIAAARRRLRIPSPPRSLYSVASCLADAAYQRSASQPNSWLTYHNTNRRQKLYCHKIFDILLFTKQYKGEQIITDRAEE